MAGTINLAFTQQFDMDGVPLNGGLLSFFTAGTTTPQSAFQDTGLTIVHPNPIVLDASGRVPMFYLSDGFIKIRLTDKNGVTIIAADQLLVIGPSGGTGGGGGGTPSDVTQFLTTGDIKARYDTGAKDGFVRLNGQSIGTTGSSATERADPACQPLFVYLWPFSNITLDGFAKGADALTDFGAGRRMFLPDLRGRTIAGMDDMGAVAANRLTTVGLGISGTTLGNAGGRESMTSAQLPAHTHSLANNIFGGNLVVGTEINSSTGGGQDHTHGWGSALGTGAGRFGTLTSADSGYDLNHHHQQTDFRNVGGITGGGTAVEKTGGTIDTGNTDLNHAHLIDVGGSTGGRNAGHAHQISGTTQSVGATANAAIVPPAMVMTIYMKM